MAKLRSIDGIFRGALPHWVGDGFWVRNYFPSVSMLVPKVSPFYFLDYHPPYVYPATDNLKRGVGPHPHRGIETVTIALEGSIAHYDSAGNSGVIGPGEVQWMTAGAGILHREYHAEEFARSGGRLHMLQLWVNLPRAHKMTPPKYQSLTRDMIPTVSLPKAAGEVRVIAGSFDGTAGPAATFTPIELFDIRLRPGGKVSVPSPKDHNTTMLFYQGKGQVNGARPVAESDLVVFGQDGDIFDVEAVDTEASAIVMCGAPIREPIASRGPFVMNEMEEIHQAFADYAAGKFGHLED